MSDKQCQISATILFRHISINTRPVCADGGKAPSLLISFSSADRDPRPEEAHVLIAIDTERGRGLVVRRLDGAKGRV